MVKHPYLSLIITLTMIFILLKLQDINFDLFNLNSIDKINDKIKFENNIIDKLILTLTMYILCWIMLYCLKTMCLAFFEVDDLIIKNIISKNNDNLKGRIFMTILINGYILKDLYFMVYFNFKHLGLCFWYLKKKFKSTELLDYIIKLSNNFFFYLYLFIIILIIYEIFLFF